MNSQNSYDRFLEYSTALSIPLGIGPISRRSQYLMSSSFSGRWVHVGRELSPQACLLRFDRVSVFGWQLSSSNEANSNGGDRCKAFHQLQPA